MHSTQDSLLPQPPPPRRPGGTAIILPPPECFEDELAVATILQEAHDATYNVARPFSAPARATRQWLGERIEHLSAPYNASEPWRLERAA